MSKAVSARSDAHQCEVCGIYGFHGFKQKDDEYHWYCFAHRLTGYTLPDLAPTPPLKGQLDLDLNIDVNGEEAFARYDSAAWPVRFMAFLRYMIVAGDKGTAEYFRFKAERRIGPANDDHLVGATVLRAANEGLFERAGHGRMRSKKAHGRETPLWQRTDRK